MSEADPRFKYKDLRPPSVPLERLDQWMESLMDPAQAKLGWLGIIFVALKIILVVLYLIARQKLIDAQMEYEKQKYERDQAQGARDDLAKDPLSGERKPGV